MKFTRAAGLVRAMVLILVAGAAVSAAQSAPTASVVEQGKFRLHKMEQAIGEESYTITRDGGSLAVKMEFKFTDRGTEVPLVAGFHAAVDLTPENFEIKGRTSRSSEIDQAIEVHGGKVRFRNRDQWSEITPPQRFFTIAGYAPTAMQMLMVRYWASHGSPTMLATLPKGNVKIEPRGRDTITIDGKHEVLNRFTIEGLIWGRETLWFDGHRRLVAAVTVDAEFDHFEAIREGYESALGIFVARAGADGMAALADLSRTIAGSQTDTLAVVGGTLIDGTGHDPVPDAAVVIEKGRIVAAGRRAEIEIPKKATVVDAQGKFILPGLWDMHAHFEQVEWGPVYLAAGVTTVRDCGNEFEFITAVRDAIAGGHGLGPRLLLAGIVDGSGPHSIGVENVDTPEQARMWTDRYHDAGFQQMKLYSSLKLEQVKVVADEAHRLGMTVTGHVPEGLNAYQTIEAGQDQINHVTYIADLMHPPLPPDAKRVERLKAVAGIDLNSAEAQKALAFLKEHHTVVDPTVALYELYTATTAKPTASFEPGARKVAPELAEQLTDVGPPSEISDLREKMFEKFVAIVGALHKAGIPVMAGTDQSVPGHSLHREIELYVQAGFTPMEAIQAATSVPAQVMGVEKEVGTVETGKRGDLIVIDGDPLQDVRATRNVEYVITNGKMYKSADLWQSVGFKP